MNIRITEKEIEDLKGINEFWGDQMPMMAMEEAGELIQAISKLERLYANNIDEEGLLPYGSGEFRDEEEACKKDVAKEMADMIISIGALMKRYGISIGELNHKIDNKLNKVY